ncbi:MAG: 23S rRNA (uracil(1939)-C(5))-methyltransferase RlmD [Elusimicrobia bacterium]|nr:23S rRNA (uracil(1939)-C(5))-methyltransferase RlmD [Elusimicrobiota bacterium]
MKIPKVITAVAEKIVFPGRTLARCSDGVALFTEGLIPGETAEIAVYKNKKTFREGDVIKVISPSDKRVAPVCKAFGVCGGCSFQYLSYQDQLYHKHLYVSELLNFLPLSVESVIPSVESLYYRNKMEFSFFTTHDGKIDLGLHRKGSFYRYSSVPPCYILDKDFLPVIDIIKQFVCDKGFSAYNKKTHLGFMRHLVLRKAQNNNELMVNIVTNAVTEGQDTGDIFKPLVESLKPLCTSIYWTQNSKKSDAVISDTLTLLHGREYITEKLMVNNKEYFFKVSPFSFFQTNSKTTQLLYQEVLNALNLNNKEAVVMDLYAGTGTIGIMLSNYVKKIISVEHLPHAVEDARTNAALNGVENIEFYADTVEKWLLNNSVSIDYIVIDPPRSGVTPKIIDSIIKLNPKKIIYVSCNPSTLARDLQMFMGISRYAVKSVKPVDMFPQTYHIETVAVLEFN